MHKNSNFHYFLCDDTRKTQIVLDGLGSFSGAERQECRLNSFWWSMGGDVLGGQGGVILSAKTRAVFIYESSDTVVQIIPKTALKGVKKI